MRTVKGRPTAPWLLAMIGLAVVLITVGLGHEILKDRASTAHRRAAESSASVPHTPSPSSTRTTGASPGPSGTAGATASSRPTGRQWRADVATVLSGGGAYLDAHRHVPKPAIVLDIDNTAVQSYYHGGSATPAVLRFERHALTDGYTVLIATGRITSSAASLRQLATAGYEVTALCKRPSTDVPLQTSKARCRRAWVVQGFTIVATLGNHTTDFAGGVTGRIYSLPNYGFLS